MFNKYNKSLVAGVLYTFVASHSSLLLADSPSNVPLASSASVAPAPTPPATLKKVVLPSGMVLKVDGMLSALSKDKKVRTLKENSLIFNHDTLFTKKDGRAAIRFNDGTYIAIGPDSALEIKNFHFTVPPKGEKYQGNPKDHASIKLYQGNLKGRIGSLVKANKPNAFLILTPRGRLTLSNPKKNPNVDMVYNNKVGLVVKALGVLNNSKGQVNITDTTYGLVSAIVGSAPTTTTTVPLVYSDVEITSTALLYNSLLSTVQTTYSEQVMSAEEKTLESEQSSTVETSSGVAVDFDSEVGDDDGDDAEDDVDE